MPAELASVANFRVLIGRRELSCCEVGPIVSRTEDGVHGHDTVVLRRALGGRELYDWRALAVAGDKRATRDVTVALLDAPGGQALHTFVLRRAWPVRWSAPALDALRTGVACEEAEVAFAELEWIDPDKRQEAARGRAA